MEYLNNLGRLKASVEQNPYLTKKERAHALGLTQATITGLWKKLRDDHERKMEEEIKVEK